VSTLDDPVTMLALEALTRELAVGGAALMLSLASEDATDECVHGLLARGTDAIVFCGGTTRIDAGGLHPDRRVRLACFDEAPTSPALYWSGFDRAKALALGAQYLHQLGHVRIGLFATGGERCADRVRGTLAGTGIDIVGGIPVGDSNAGGSVSDALDHWCSLLAPPTALVCGSDVAAVAVLRECKRREIAVPAQWSVIGFGDTELSRQVQPLLTTLRVPAREAGQALARIFLASFEGRSEAAPELSAKHVVRESTGAMRG
jgi:LacI family transcriptional regulator